jgi:hypothetical protein
VKVRTKPGPKTRGRPGRGAFDPETADRLVERLRNTLFAEQQAVFDDDGDYISFLVPRGGGKTSAWLMRAIRRCVRTKRARCLFIATTREQARILIWDDLKDVVDKLGLGEETGESSFNESRCTFTLTRTGSTIRLVGADDTHEIDKLRGKSFHEIGIDEGASHGLKLLRDLVERVLSPRLGNTDGVICLFGTPGHMLQGLFYDVTRPGSPEHRPYVERDNPDVKPALWSSHAWSLEDGAKHVPAIAKLWERALKDKRKKGWSDDHPVWVRERLGRWAADDTENIYRYRPHLEDGSPWNEWDPERVGPLRIAKLPSDRKDWIVGFGADMGAADPFALHAFAASPSDPTRALYHIFEFEAAPDAKMYAKRIAELLFGPDTGSGLAEPQEPERPHRRGRLARRRARGHGAPRRGDPRRAREGVRLPVRAVAARVRRQTRRDRALQRRPRGRPHEDPEGLEARDPAVVAAVDHRRVRQGEGEQEPAEPLGRRRDHGSRHDRERIRGLLAGRSERARRGDRDAASAIGRGRRRALVVRRRGCVRRRVLGRLGQRVEDRLELEPRDPVAVVAAREFGRNGLAAGASERQLAVAVARAVSLEPPEPRGLDGVRDRPPVVPDVDLLAQDTVGEALDDDGHADRADVVHVAGSGARKAGMRARSFARSATSIQALSSSASIIRSRTSPRM